MNKSLNINNKKKSQLTIYIIVGILIILLIVIAFMLNKNKLSNFADSLAVKELLQKEIKEKIDYCIEEVAVPGIYLLAANGGYIYDYYDILPVENIQIAYQLRNKNRNNISIDFMEKELSNFIELTIFNCISEVDGGTRYEYEYTKPTVQTKINQNEVIVDLEMNAKQTRQEGDISVNEFLVKIPSKLGSLIEINNEIVMNLLKNDSISYRKLSDLNSNIKILPYDKNRIVYSIYSENSDLVPLVFNTLIYKDVEEYSKFIVKDIPYLKARVNERFTYSIGVDNINKKLSFYDNTVLFEIDEDLGVIDFIPLKNDLGEHIVSIEITDGIYSLEKEINIDISD